MTANWRKLLKGKVKIFVTGILTVAEDKRRLRADAARCAGHDQQLGSESLLLNLVEGKG